MARPQTVIKWPGGKAQSIGAMMRLRPPFEPTTLVDAMAGSCAWGLAAHALFPSAMLWLNDTNEQLTDALLAIRDDAAGLARRLRMTPYSRVLFNRLKRQQYVGPMDWVTLNRQAVGGALRHTGTGWSRDRLGKKRTQWQRLPAMIEDMGAALCGQVCIECQDFEPLLFGGSGQRFGLDSPAAWIYADPPYPGTEGYYGNADFDHRRLAAALNRCRGAVMVSYADTPAFREFAAEFYPADRWRYESYEATQHMQLRSGTPKGRRTELLLLNYEPGEVKS